MFASASGKTLVGFTNTGGPTAEDIYFTLLGLDYVVLDAPKDRVRSWFAIL